MEAAFLVMIREGFEAALIVAIVLAYLRKIGRKDLFRPVWFGVAVAALCALAFGILVHTTVAEFEGDTKLRINAAISIFAVVVLTWMVFWMQRQSRAIKGDLERKVDAAIAEGGSMGGLVAVAFLSVLREGMEASLFLIAAATGQSGRDVLIGGLIGLTGAFILGYVVYVGGHKIPMKSFFTVTGMIVIVFAAGLCSKAVLFLQASSDLGSLNMAFYNTTHYAFLTQSTEFGKFLAALFGWDPRPSVEQVIAWLGYFVPVTFLFLRHVSPSTPKPVRRSTAGAVA
jgi:high-affinity iron transporter